MKKSATFEAHRVAKVTIVCEKVGDVIEAASIENHSIGYNRFKRIVNKF